MCRIALQQKKIFIINFGETNNNFDCTRIQFVSSFSFLLRKPFTNNYKIGEN